MENLKEELTTLIVETMIPECEAYLEELHQLIENKTATADDMETIKDMESFLVELQNILEAIKENKLSDEDIEDVYGKITSMLDEHAQQ